MISPRAARVHLAVDVLVSGTNELGDQFKEITKTILISASGGLIELETPVAKEQKLSLANMKTRAKITCHVTSLQSSDNERAQIGIRFDEPSPHFWGLGFPPEDWNPADRKLPDLHQR
jgi:hypothetical protein